jgi:hypothetical protein
MNGSAPKSPATGSQIEVCQKPIPNFWIDSHDSLINTARYRRRSRRRERRTRR